MKAKTLIRLTLLSALVVGCSMIQSFPNVARTGDTVMIALMPTDGYEILRTEDVTVNLVDSGGTSHPVFLRQLSRAYGDPTSDVALKGGMSGLGTPSEYYAGQWLAIVDLVDRNDPYGQALVIEEGVAQLQFNHPSKTLPSQALNIIPGSGVPHRFDSSEALSSGVQSRLYRLNPAEQLAITVSGTPSGTLGAAKFTIHYNASDFDAHRIRAPRAVKLSQDSNLQLISSTVDLGNGSMEISVILMNPHGFNGATPGYDTSRLTDVAFAIVWEDQNKVDDTNWQGIINLMSTEYVSIDGAPVTGLTASIDKVR